MIFKLIDSRPGPPRKTVHTHKLWTVDQNRLKCDQTELKDVISEESTVDRLFDKLHAKLTTILDTHAPKKCKTVIIRPNTQWYNKNIRQAKVLRRRYERALRKSQSLVDYEQFKNQTKYVNFLKTAKNRILFLKHP